jgi:flagellar operon protein
MHINHNRIVPLPGVGGLPQGQTNVQNTPNTPIEGNFHQVMEGVLHNKRELQFSKHASMRLNARDIRLDKSQMERLEQGVAKAHNKGIRDSLVLIDDIALVVNITNKVVVTALNRQDQVFTNIDGAVIV